MKPVDLFVSEDYENRNILYSDLFQTNGWKFKVYTVTHKNNTPPDEKIRSIAEHLTIESLESYGKKMPGYGAGYIILHKGMDMNLLVINWWTGENMRCTVAYLSRINNPYEFIDVTESGCTVCVWDDLIHRFERDSWVENILSKSKNPDMDGYIKSIYK
jgi:hypothetical protein